MQQVNVEQQLKFTKQSTNQYSSFSLQLTNEVKVLEAIDSVNNSYSKDLFHINTVLLKRNRNNFVKPLTHLINLSIQSGQFPTIWKQAKVMPLFKSGTPDQACNYQPVSILPVFSKVLEKIVYGQLLTFIQSNNILHPLQFGFCPQYSTETANCFFVEQLKFAIDKGEIVGAVFLDLKKAFDTLNHDILIHKLSNFNFTPLALQWFKSYLE